MNVVTLTGRLTKDPTQKMTQKGTAVSEITLAVNRRIKSEGQPEADFIRCIAFGKTAETIGHYLQKGALIGVTGSIQTGSYDNLQGQKVYTTDVLVNAFDFLEKRNDGQSVGQYQQQNNFYISDDDLPF